MVLLIALAWREQYWLITALIHQHQREIGIAV